jgi:hypothetical protein
MKGEPTVVARARARSRGPIKEKPDTNRAPNANPNWCACGSKQPITTKIELAGKEPTYACSQCGERAPFHAHISRIDKRDFKASKNKNFIKYPNKNQGETTT